MNDIKTLEKAKEFALKIVDCLDDDLAPHDVLIGITTFLESFFAEGLLEKNLEEVREGLDLMKSSILNGLSKQGFN